MVDESQIILCFIGFLPLKFVYHGAETSDHRFVTPQISLQAQIQPIVVCTRSQSSRANMLADRRCSTVLSDIHLRFTS